MGGRRSYSLKDVVGTGRKVDSKKEQLATSFKSGNIEGVTRNSANLVQDHKNIGEIIIYAKKLLTSIKEKYSPDELKNVKKISDKVKIDWAALKQKENITATRIIDSAVVDSVSRTLKEISR